MCPVAYAFVVICSALVYILLTSLSNLTAPLPWTQHISVKGSAILQKQVLLHTNRQHVETLRTISLLLKAIQSDDNFCNSRLSLHWMLVVLKRHVLIQGHKFQYYMVSMFCKSRSIHIQYQSIAYCLNKKVVFKNNHTVM
jgi:hypothetical protein